MLGDQVLLVLQVSLSSGVIAAIAAAVLAVAAIVDAQDGEKVTAPEPIPATEEEEAEEESY